MEIQNERITSLDICVDFDGTVVTHEYPRVGRDIGAVPVLKELVAAGHRLILFTMREKIGLDRLKDAVDWFEDNGIPLYGIQTNPEQKSWTDSPKALASLHIDDAGLGCPLIYPKNARPYVNWQEVRKMLANKGILPLNERNFRVFLDDERNPEDVFNFLTEEGKGWEAQKYISNDWWTVVRTYHEFVGHIATYGIPEMISFDHDLADFSGPNREERTGMDCAKWLISVCLDLSTPKKFPSCYVHSKNTVGAENIQSYIDQYRRQVSDIHNESFIEKRNYRK